MEIAIIAIVAFLSAILTFFSGFGLGTLLTPVFIVFFPIETAIALSGVVHFFNNLFKLFLVGKMANREVLIKFGIPAVMAAFLGSKLLLYLGHWKPFLSYTAFGQSFDIVPINLILAILLLFFALMDMLPYFNRWQFGKDKLIVGGFLSGFFGGLSGHQGALRSAFLIKSGLSKEVFIGTAVVVSACVDFTRLGVYASRLTSDILTQNITLLSIATLAAMSGAYLGNRWLKKVTFKKLQVFVAIMLMIISLALGFGLI